ncbi:MAG: 2-C-methyl-D-erythritol 4-phosphate cytidylyltransferase [Dysgonamonadaceae bacterium]|jgi:2-C-methyl-D-erythritol 4-phosphate cytidylyltransferase|nr:2-C-methyl-D-erythritol 4-phosphate cytidylyltransferase [Dysgonamonadaceae bacterium]
MIDKYAIITAGGKGLRMGAEIPKQFLPLNGNPVLMRTLSAFFQAGSSIRLILVLPENQQDYWKKLCSEYNFNIPHTVVSGGETRFHSVKNGLDLIPGNALVAVHDGVRPLISTGLIIKAFDAAEIQQAVYPVVPVTDTLREGLPEDESRMVDRSQFRLVQTPQVFCSGILKKAYQLPYSESFTDDVSVVEAAGVCRPKMIEGEKSNIKITTPVDLIIATALLNGC